MYKPDFQLPNLRRHLLALFLVMDAGSNGLLFAADADIRMIRVELGDYRFMPGELQLVVGQPVVLQFVNTDTLSLIHI